MSLFTRVRWGGEEHRFFERRGMVELGGHNSPVSLLDVANEKKIFFLVTLQAGLTKGGG
jgi:hypothetical protein